MRTLKLIDCINHQSSDDREQLIKFKNELNLNAQVIFKTIKYLMLMLLIVISF